MGASFLSPYDPDVQNRALPFIPPTRLHWVDARGKWHLLPFVYAYMALPDGFAAYEPDTKRAFPVRFFVNSPRQQPVGGTYSRYHLFGTDEGGRIFLLGTDRYGRDQLSRLLYGGRVSLMTGFIAAVLSVGLGRIFSWSRSRCRVIDPLPYWQDRPRILLIFRCTSLIHACI